jgi:lysophospholipase L1-like esterase
MTVGIGCGSSTGQPMADAGGDAGPPGAMGVVAAGVRWFGRVDTTTNAAEPRFAWSGTGFIAHIMGTSLTAQLSVSGAAQIFTPVLDGTPQANFTAQPGVGSYTLATAPTVGEHNIELYRQTEGPQGETQLMALTTDGTLMDPPAGPGRLIEAIGDSITCGYGDLGTLADTECYSTESHWDTYESVIARTLGAEVSTIAASGRGVVRNYGGDSIGTMPMVYGRTLSNYANPAWDFHIQPQAVIINLGTNDIATGDPGSTFSDTYLAFLQTIRTNYPDAYIFCILAPLLNSGQVATIGAYIQEAVNTMNDPKVEYFNHIPPQTTDKQACQYHPNKQENQMMADLLIPEIQAKLGW